MLFSPTTCFQKDEEGYLYCREVSAFECYVYSLIVSGLVFIITGIYGKHYDHFAISLIAYIILSLILATVVFIPWICSWWLTCRGAKKNWRVGFKSLVSIYFFVSSIHSIVDNFVSSPFLYKLGFDKFYFAYRIQDIHALDAVFGSYSYLFLIEKVIKTLLVFYIFKFILFWACLSKRKYSSLSDVFSSEVDEIERNQTDVDLTQSIFFILYLITIGKAVSVSGLKFYIFNLIFDILHNFPISSVAQAG